MSTIPARDPDDDEFYHVTFRRNGGLYGHPLHLCDGAACAGYPRFLGEDDETVEVGGVYEFDAAGRAVARLAE